MTSNSRSEYPFFQVDVFGEAPLGGNPVAVVLCADGIDDATMQRFAAWTNLSETTFVCAPTDPTADYRLRIFTPTQELAFAGHPTLGSCHAWLNSGGVARATDHVVQQCGDGLVVLRRTPRLAFAAPPLRRREPLTDDELVRCCDAVGITPDSVRAHQVLDNGPEFHTLFVDGADVVLGITPNAGMMGDMMVAVAGPYADDPAPPAWCEVRVFAPAAGVPEDPVTGSLNAALAQWLIGDGLAPPTYTASQGTKVGRTGRVFVSSEGGETWIAGTTVTRIAGSARL